MDMEQIFISTLDIDIRTYSMLKVLKQMKQQRYEGDEVPYTDIGIGIYFFPNDIYYTEPVYTGYIIYNIDIYIYLSRSIIKIKK